MGRWKSERNYNGDYEVITGKSLRGVTFANPIGSDMVISAHNADCDAYEARIAELEALVARVKAESLRVVVAEQRCALSECREKFYIQSSCCHDTKVTPNNIQADFRRHPDTTVLPVRLERWETAE